MLQRELLAIAAASQSGWTPLALGSSLLAWWDCDRPDLITAPGGVVSSWKDIKNGYDKTASTTACPTFSATSWKGTNAGITFDGVANCLTLASPNWLPTGSAGSEDWYLYDETAPASETASSRFLGSWGGTGSANTQRRNGGIGITTAYVARSTTGTGAATVTNSSTVTMLGRHVLRYVTEATQAWNEVDGVASTPTAVATNTLTQNLRTGATASTAAANFAQGVMACRIITGPLTTAQANQLRAWLTRRL